MCKQGCILLWGHDLTAVASHNLTFALALALTPTLTLTAGCICIGPSGRHLTTSQCVQPVAVGSVALGGWDSNMPTSDNATSEGALPLRTLPCITLQPVVASMPRCNAEGESDPEACCIPPASCVTGQERPCVKCLKSGHPASHGAAGNVLVE